MRDPKGVKGMVAEKKATKKAAPKKQAWRLARDLKTDRRRAETVEVGSEVQLVLGTRNAYPGYDVLGRRRAWWHRFATFAPGNWSRWRRGTWVSMCSR
jgi:hypothetical protein